MHGLICTLNKNLFHESGVKLIVAEDASESNLCELAKGVDAIMTNWAKTTANVIGSAENCKIVARLGIGLDNIDIAHCTARKVPVTNVPDYCLIEVAEHALAMIYALGRQIAFFHHETKKGIYDLQAAATMRRMEGQTVGIVGLGNTGRCLAKKCVALGFKVCAAVRRPEATEPEDGVEIVGLDDLLSQSDYISIHAPLTDQTKHLFDAEAFGKMKDSAYLINTSRGGLVDHVALWNALENNELAGAALDVHEPEPPDLSLPLYKDPRVIINPHAAFVSEESLADLRRRTVLQVLDALNGKRPANVCNPEIYS